MDNRNIVDEEKRSLVLMKVSSALGLKRTEMSYVWYNPHDPWFLRYAKDKDFRYVKVIPVKAAQMTSAANRTKPRAMQMVHNCQKRWKIKFATKSGSWTLYFQSQNEFDEWFSIFSHVREVSEGNPPTSQDQQQSSGSPSREASSSSRNILQENWYSSRYGGDGGKSSLGSSPSTVTAKSAALLSQRPPVMLIVELPQSMGFVRLGLHKLDTQVVTVERFKERMFEALHMFFHSSALLLTDPAADSGSMKLDRSTSACPSKYSRKGCQTCGGVLRAMISRQMFRQEEVLSQGPELFALQVGSVFQTKDYKPSNAEDVKILNPRFVQRGGLYRDHQQSSEDELLLKSFEFVSSPLGKGVSKSVEDCLDWIDDESIALSTLVERYAQTKPVARTEDLSTAVIHLMLRPGRELPVSRFFVNVSRYTREYDAVATFSLYSASVRHASLKWEIRRRYSDFRDLDSALRALDPSLPKLPREARRTKFVWNHSVENDELRLIRELNVYLRVAVSEKNWDPPPKELLVFAGVLSTGKNDLASQTVRIRDRKLAHLDALRDLAEFGDLVLFRSVNPMSGLQRRVTGNCVFDHVGMVVKRSKAGYDLLEATGEGVTAYPLEERLEAYYGGFCDLIALRKVRFDRTEEACRALAEFTNQVEGKPYKLSLGKLVSGRVLSVTGLSSQRKREYFCSELVAEALRVIGVFSRTGRPDSFFLPHFFDENGVAESYLSGGAAMDDIVFIDCINPEIKFSNKAA